jgi:DNA-binding transcriptional LysR family regulator
LLRTLVLIVDLRSYTQAAHAMNVTQPAVSAQIKRLQTLLGEELFDKSAPGVTLTMKGEVVVNYARRMLAINDQIVEAVERSRPVDYLRVGIPSDYFEGLILEVIAGFRRAHPEMRVHISADASESLLRDLRRGDFDLVVAASDEEQATGARKTWREENAWVAASRSVFEAAGPVPLAVLGENGQARRLSVAAFEQAGQPYEIVYVGRSFFGMIEAVASGLAVTCWSKRLLRATGLEVFDSALRLPRIADLHGGVHLREGLDGPMVQELADSIAAALTDAAPASPRQRAVAGVQADLATRLS